MSEFMANLLLNSVVLSILILLILLITPLCKKYSHRWRYIAFLVIGIKLLIPFSFMPESFGINIPVFQKNGVIEKNVSVQSDMEIKSQKEKSTLEENNIPQNITSDSKNLIKSVNDQKNVQVGKQETQKKEMASVVENWIVNFDFNQILQIAFIIWGVVTGIVLIGYILIYQFHKRNIKRWSSPVTDKEVLRIFHEERESIGITPNIDFVQCRKINTPMAMGILHTTILIPYMKDYEGLRYILRHELIHHKRHDMYTKVFYVIVKSVHWFNPLVRRMVKNAYDDIELLCDDEVVRGLEYSQRIEYNESILNMAKTQCKYEDTEKIVFSLGLVQGKNDLKERMLNIMNMKNKKNGYMIAAAICVIAIMGGSMIGCGSDNAQNGKTMVEESTVETTTVNIRETNVTTNEKSGTTHKNNSDAMEVVYSDTVKVGKKKVALKILLNPELSTDGVIQIDNQEIPINPEFAENVGYAHGEAEAYDFTGDGKEEIAFIISGGASGSMQAVQVFEETDGKWNEIPIPSDIYDNIPKFMKEQQDIKIDDSLIYYRTISFKEEKILVSYHMFADSGTKDIGEICKELFYSFDKKEFVLGETLKISQRQQRKN